MNKTIFSVIALVAIMMTMIATTPTSAFAKNEGGPKAYDSGFNHGCSDAHIYVASDRYINQDEKGPAYHSQDFMDGYYAGFKECGYDNGVLIDNSNVDDHSNQQEQNQAAYTHQNGSCPGILLIGDCNIGQQSRNNFAANAEN